MSVVVVRESGHVVQIVTQPQVVAIVAGGPRGAKGDKGDKGDTGPIGPDKHFTWSQTEASDVWTIFHGLGKYPAVEVLDSTGHKIIADVEYVDLDRTVVRHASATTGKAIHN